MGTYITSGGETIIDVCLNTVGSIIPVLEVIEENNIDSWDIVFTEGVELSFPDTIYNNAVILQALKNPFISTGLISPSERETLLSNFKDLIK